MQYTLADLEQNVYSQLDDNSLFYTQAEVDRAINEAIRVLNLYTGYLQESASGGTTTAGRVFYDTPAAILWPTAVYYGGRVLKKATLSSMGGARKRWLADTGSAYGPVAEWVPIGIRKYALHPACSRGGVALTVEGVAEPSPMVNATDLTEFPDEYLDTLTDLAVHTLPLKEGGKVFADSATSYQEFLKGVQGISMWQRLKQPRFRVDIEAAKR